MINTDGLKKEQIEALKQVEEEFRRKNKNPVKKPKWGEEYFFITASGGINKLKWLADTSDDKQWGIGNVYFSFKEAKYALEKREVETELQKYADEHNEGKIDWCDSQQEKIKIIYYHAINSIRTYADCYAQHNDIYFTSEEIAIDAVNYVGEERIKKYIFGVEE